MDFQLISFILHIDQYLATLISQYGTLVYFLLFIIIFIETGLVVMPFLPGDSLLFIAGAFAAAGTLNFALLFFLLSLAAILGDTVNYWIGSYSGERIFSRFINKEYLVKTKLFFEKKGKKTIIIARFVPIIRTFAPFVAGVGKMNYLTFISYNVVGGIIWVGSFIMGGYFFGNIPIINEHITSITLLIIVISFIPAVVEYIRHKK